METKPMKNSTSRKRKIYGVLLVCCLILTGITFLKNPFFHNLISYKDEVIHGPHLGSELSFVVFLDSVEDNLASVTKSRWQRNRNGATSSVSSTPSPATSTTPITSTTPSDPTTQTPVLTTTTIQPGYGIAAGGGLTWMNQADLDAYFSGLKMLGVTWIRWDVDWSAIQPNNSTTYDWSGPDRVSATATKYGINSLAIITYAPLWALDSSQGCVVNDHCPPKDIAVFAHFAGVTAARYSGTVSTWEIWNEPNLNNKWSTAGGGGGYPEYLKAAYTAIKQANPNATVISAGLAAAADTTNNTSPNTFVMKMYSSGAKNYFDALALHPYSYPVLPDYVASWNSWQQMTTVHNTMIANGDVAKKIWITEYGAPTGGSGTAVSANQLQFSYGSDYMTELAQQQMMQTVLTLYSQNKSWMGPFFWYSFKDLGTSKETPENFFGLLRFDGSQKPAYTTLKQGIGG